MSEPTKNCNHLGEEKSPYLLQHKDNPVCWYAWGEAAFKAAREQNKPIFLSIGYSTCYWCHVMEKDSFEQEVVAKVLNEKFISIKVDREERPDVDQIYMDAIHAMRGRGGWPLNVFLTNDLKPFWGGTFFYREQFIQILNQLSEAWVISKDKIEENAEEIRKHLEDKIKLNESVNLNDEIFNQIGAQYLSRFDDVWGGFGAPPKFPPSMQIGLLLRIHKRLKNKKALEMAKFTLEKMARGGIYDHLGGGFARYSTDEKWLVPHFEKMLYDNAKLSFVYLEAYQVTKNEMYKEVARGILDYVLEKMTSKEKAFYSAEDAGEVDKEGEYYVWTESEINKLLNKEESKKFKEVYGVTKTGNFEHSNNILNLNSKFDWKEKKDSTLKAASQKMLRARSKRKSPHLDDKILTAWNGLMISSFTKGFQVIGDMKYLKAAQAAAKFIKEKLFNGKTLFRRYRDGDRRFEGYLEDYAYYIQALIHLYESDFNSEWLKLAKKLQMIQDENFWDKKNFGYFYSTGSELIVRKKDFSDNAIPSANSVSLHNLIRLNSFFTDEKFREKIKNLSNIFAFLIKKHPLAYPEALQAIDYLLDTRKEIVLVEGENKDLAEQVKNYLYTNFNPNKVFSIVTEDSKEFPDLHKYKIAKSRKTTVYVCENQICKEPKNSFFEFEKLL